MYKNFILLVLISIYLCMLSPDENNPILLEEYEIKCNKGFITYKIINSQNKKYLLFIKNNNIDEYELFEEDTKLSYETSSFNNYYYPIKSNTVLYLVLRGSSEYCISFKYTDTTLITLKENEEYFHPITDNMTTIEASINNVLNKHIILYFKNINTNFYLYINNKKIKYSDDDIYNFISKEKESKLRLEISNPKIVASIKYVLAPSYNISDDTFQCIDNSEPQYFYIKYNSGEKDYVFISFTNSNHKLYVDGILITDLNYIAFTWKSNIYIISKDKGCFQIYYLKHGFFFYIDEDNKSLEKSFNILNSETYKFIMCNDYEIKGDKEFTISISSNENNFLKQLEIGESELQKQDIEIIKKDEYLYEFDYIQTANLDITHLNMNFNLNDKEYITITIKLKLNYIEGIVWMCLTLGIFFTIVIGFYVIKYCLRKMEEKKEDEKYNLYKSYYNSAAYQDMNEQFKKERKEEMKVKK